MERLNAKLDEEMLIVACKLRTCEFILTNSTLTVQHNQVIFRLIEYSFLHWENILEIDLENWFEKLSLFR